MDLGSLELQIFVSLTVVLGGAFVALVCDYLKGNNEQLREHNIELRVRKEEQERKLLLDPVGFLGQMLPGGSSASRPGSQPASAGSRASRAANVHEVMQSFAAPEALMEAETRASRLHARNPEEEYETADVPPLTQRRGRPRPGRKPAKTTRPAAESYADWVRPEVIARIARKADAAAAYGSDIREELDSEREAELPQPLNAADNWDIRQKIVPNREKQTRAGNESERRTAESVEKTCEPALAAAEITVPVVTEEAVTVAEYRLTNEEAARLQREIERVSQLERQPAAPAPGTILRP